MVSFAEDDEDDCGIWGKPYALMSSSSPLRLYASLAPSSNSTKYCEDEVGEEEDKKEEDDDDDVKVEDEEETSEP